MSCSSQNVRAKSPEQHLWSSIFDGGDAKWTHNNRQPIMQNKTVIAAIQELDNLNREFSANRVSSVEHGATRERILSEALESMAADFGVRLQAPLQIDSNGEYSLVAMNKDNSNPQHYGSGPFGAGFAALLSPHGPRMGIQPAKSIDPSNGWCRMNHFSVERMVRQYGAAQAEDQLQAESPRG